MPIAPPTSPLIDLVYNDANNNVGDTISIEKIEREYNTDFTRRGLS